MKYFLLFLLTAVIVQLSVAPPVNQKSKDGEHINDNKVEDVEEMEDVMEYRRYLTEVVQVLESDPDFRTKLQEADEADIRTGKIADQLQFVSHNIRTRLDEIKREELERLRHLATKQNELKNGIDTEHLDLKNTHTFEIQDLKKLIAKTTEDLAKADRKRREEFKQHEMERKYEEEEKLKHMTEVERKKYEQELQAMKEKQKHHESVNHPGSKHQLEEVWEKQDQMATEEFNPKTFFFYHDVDGNGVWDQDEVKALFLQELDKLYDKGTPQADLLKRAEEMERMREHVFNEADLNKDGLISYEEFLEQTKKPDFQQDEGWVGLDEQQVYNEEEFEAFRRHKQEEMIRQGMLPEHPGNIPVQQEPFPPQYGHVPAHGVVPPQVDVRGPSQQNLPQQQFQNHPPQYYQQQGNIVTQHHYPNHVPVQPIHDQIPQQQQQQQHQQQQQQQHQQQQQQFHGQIPVNQQYQQMEGQIPVQQNQASVQQQQIPVQPHQPQASNFQQQHNTVNQVPQNVQNNAVPPLNDPNQLNLQPVQPAVQQDVNRNIIPSVEKGKYKRKPTRIRLQFIRRFLNFTACDYFSMSFSIFVITLITGSLLTIYRFLKLRLPCQIGQLIYRECK